MKHLNQENIDELMFMLLEGEITGEERERLLEAIHADPEYSKMWAAWQNTIVMPANDIPEFNSDKLKKANRPVFAVHIRRYAAAAVVVLASFLTLHFINSADNDSEIEYAGTAPIRPNKPVIKSPEQNDRVTRNPLLIENDTHKNKMEVIKTMAKHSVKQPENRAMNLKNPEILNDIPVDNSDRLVKEVEIPNPITEKNPEVIQAIPAIASNDDIQVTIVTTKFETPKTTYAEKENLFSRILGGSKIKLENDSNTRTNKKIVIENKKYQIIAGF